MRADAGDARVLGGEAMDLLSRRRGGHDTQRVRDLCERFDLDPVQRTAAACFTDRDFSIATGNLW